MKEGNNATIFAEQMAADLPQVSVSTCGSLRHVCATAVACSVFVVLSLC